MGFNSGFKGLMQDHWWNYNDILRLTPSLGLMFFVLNFLWQLKGKFAG